MKSILKNPSGFSMVGALTAAGIGAIAVLGLTQMSSNIMSNLGKSKQIFNMVTLSEEIRHSFQDDAPTPCDHTTLDCWNACTSSLIGISTSGAGQNFAIKAPSPLPAGMGAGDELYKGGETYKGIKIQEIKYVPYAPNLGTAHVHFSLTEDTRETLTAPQSLVFAIFITKGSGSIEECVVASTKIAGAGLSGIADSCRQVDGEPPDHPTGKRQTLLGCAGTDGKDGSEKPEKDIAFGYKSGGDFDAAGGAGAFSTGEENTFFGYETGKHNTSGKSNIFLGHQAGWKNTTGENNIFLGHQTGYKVGTDESKANTTGSNNILIGRQIVLSGPTDSNILNIGNLITADKLYLAAPDYPTVKLEGQVKIEPPMDLPKPLFTGPDTKPGKTTTPEPGLFVLGEMHINKKVSNPPKIEFQVEDTKTSPAIRVIADILKMTKEDRSATPTNPDVTVPIKVEGTTYKKLTIEADLDVDGKPGGVGPGLSVKGPIKLTDRNDPTADTIQIKSIGPSSPAYPRLEIDGGLNVAGNGTSRFLKNLKVKKNLKAVTGNIRKLEVTEEVNFQSNIETPNTLTVTIGGNATITTANIERLQVGISATINSLNPESHIHQEHFHPQYERVGHNHNSECPCPGPACGCCCPGCTCSSQIIKRNIKPLKDYEKSLQNIVNTPLFTWQYKKDKGDHPEKVRMGVISEELPKSLQILEKGKPSTPDWFSIYGTLWAGIKVLNQKLQELKSKSMAKLTELSKELKTYLTDHISQFKKDLIAQTENLKSQLTEITQGTQNQAQSAKEFSELKKQFQEAILTLKSRQKELKKIRTELKSIRQQLKEAESI